VTLRVPRPSGVTSAVVRELPLRAAALVALVLVGYNYSLATLARGLTLQTPLAYLALVPLIAVGLAVAHARIQPPTLPIHDRQLDWIVGLGLFAASAAVLILMPQATNSTFWLQRLDLLTLPLFVAGLIALLFGVRRLWTLKGPVAFLLLAWPVPYSLLLAGAAGQFAELTAKAVAAVTTVVPVARPSVGDDTLFIVGSGARAFSVSVGSACAGVNGFVGFLIVGIAMLSLVRGPLPKRLAWLSVGLVVIYGLNVARILAILCAGVTLGQAAAFEVLHPVAGLIVFNIGVIAMVLLVPRFGLSFIGRVRGTGSGDGPPGRQLPDVVETAPRSRENPVRRARFALLVAVSMAGVLAVTNAAYARFDAISSGLGDSRLAPFDVRDAKLSGWDHRFISAFPMATQYFGGSATWDRAVYWAGPAAAVASSRSVYLDVITTDDPGTFASYTLEACYRFHGYQIESITTADIGAGVQAQVIDYHNTKVDADWSILWWEWPYSDGLRTRYERIVLLMSEGPNATFRGELASDVDSASPAFHQTDRFLVTVARDVVRTQLGTASR
jgi:exosortase/archaeosortase family protein